jgi:hypothetical protein
MKTFARRLRRLEVLIQPTLRAVAAFDPASTDRLRGTLAAAGLVAGPVESLAEVWARAMGISCIELRALLERRATGLSVE